MARENFSIGALYNITKSQDNPIKTGRRQVRSWSATNFQPVCDQLRTSFEPDSEWNLALSDNHTEEWSLLSHINEPPKGTSCVEGRRDQKTERQRNLTVANWVFAETTYVVGSKQNLHGCRLVEMGLVPKYQISSKSVKPFGRCGGCSKFSLSDCFRHWLIYNSLYYRTSRDNVETTVSSCWNRCSILNWLI